MFKKILVVCIGNICRSPVAAAMLRQALPDRQIESAGLGALVGEGVEPRARLLAEADGLEVAAHRARQLTAELLEACDLVLVMSAGQRRAIGELVPAALGKTMLLGHWLAENQGREIPDPYGQSSEAFVHTHRLLRAATAAWAARL
jgi:protein-tyrosine phosphatase